MVRASATPLIVLVLAATVTAIDLLPFNDIDKCHFCTKPERSFPYYYRTPTYPTYNCGKECGMGYYKSAAQCWKEDPNDVSDDQRKCLKTCCEKAEGKIYKERTCVPVILC